MRSLSPEVDWPIISFSHSNNKIIDSYMRQLLRETQKNDMILDIRQSQGERWKQLQQLLNVS